MEYRVASLERLKALRLNSLLVSGGDRVEVGEITFGRGERDRLRFDDLPNGHCVRWAHADECARHSREISVRRSLQECAAPNFAPQAAVGAQSFHRSADCVARDPIFAREKTLIGKAATFAPLSRLDPPAQRHFDVAGNPLGHAPPELNHFWPI